MVDTEQTDNPTSDWYVVHTYSGQEERVRRNLENRIESLDVQNLVLSVVVPTEEQIEMAINRFVFCEGSD